MAREQRFDVLFEPVRIGPVTTKNRFYQVPHCTGMGYRRPQTLAAMREVKAEGVSGGQAEVVALRVGTHFLGVFPVESDCHHLEFPGIAPASQPREIIRARATDRAPGRKKVNQGRPPGSIAKFVGFAREGLAGKAGRRLPVHRQHIAGLNARGRDKDSGGEPDIDQCRAHFRSARPYRLNVVDGHGSESTALRHRALTGARNERRVPR